MKKLRTPEERFENLPDFSFKPNYFTNMKGFDDLRLHYLDEGPKDSEYVFLCLHGQPTWSYLYRKMIPIFLEEGFRCVAPDFFGFGRSDKPEQDHIYTFEFHRKTLIRIITLLDLRNIILVCQDWGGILGLTLPMDFNERFSHLLIMNTILGTGDYKITQGFLDFKNWVNKNPNFDIGRLLCRACPNLNQDECAAYSAPFPTEKYKAGVRRFPNLVPLNPNDPGAKISKRAEKFLKNKFNGKAFMAIGMEDPVFTHQIMKHLRKIIHNCSKPLELAEAGHFVQEWGDVVAKKALKYFELD